jgi:hypothetical protein
MVEGIKQVNEVQQLSPSNFKLQTSNADAVRKQILQLALQHTSTSFLCRTKSKPWRKYSGTNGRANEIRKAKKSFKKNNRI